MKWRFIPIAVLFGLAAWQIGSGLYIPAKALLAQLLLHDAWRQTLAGVEQAKPWPWADTWPVARLRAPEHGVDLMVLAGASGASLAFGPGHLLGTPAPGHPGNSVIGGHRDTSLSFLRHVKTGDLFVLELPDGSTQTYKVTGSATADARRPWPSPDVSHPMLTLVTCYPFDAITPGGPLRYLVFAEATDTGNPASGQPYSAHGYNPRGSTNR
ncbi:MAG: class GN sortase [Pseudomonadota bacterium]|nr:class GN sortase [Pseudomonadota bacterium]